MSTGQPISGVLLAAGLARRFGGTKLFLRWNGRPLVRHMAETALASRLDELIVVTGHRADEVVGALDGLPARVVHNPDYEQGLSSSLRTGVAAVESAADGILIMLADQPLVTATVIDRLIAAYHSLEFPIVATCAGGRRGNPVLFARSLFAELLQVTGDEGARAVIAARRDQVHCVEVESEVLEDMDTREAYDKLVNVRK